MAVWSTPSATTPTSPPTAAGSTVVDELAYGDFTLLVHNGAFDGCALGRLLANHNAEGHPVPPSVLGGEVENLVSRMSDTMLMSHLIDPRTEQDGGRGHGLKPLSDHHLGEGSIDSQAALKSRFKDLRLSIKEGFRTVPLWDSVYLTYAGVDPLLTFRLHEVLGPMIDELGLTSLSRFEHEVATICAGMTARGFRVDQVYAHELSELLYAEQTNAEHRAEGSGSTSTTHGRRWST